ncbi:uncharacterized protein LY79DRAFT_662764 [Colletotrichum navitas]|uniref:Uncharacterized protein n=1 Tax=Colletotrichum navitas TaxID=681940 RepID=A0AAD8UY95_9PEZI|nr:uncharacterized protein LY79DRAFT_662764 [Colletotrichum navitas]KAK1573506.1 hypothetical protein LY79DRAFT_662764 [Colletotrichum navitas]
MGASPRTWCHAPTYVCEAVYTLDPTPSRGRVNSTSTSPTATGASSHPDDHDEQDVGMAPSQTDIRNATSALAKVAAALLKTEADAKKAAKRRKLLVSLCAAVAAADASFRGIPPLASAAAAGDARSEPVDPKLARFVRAAQEVLEDGGHQV